jgi:hypothetical protein
MSAFGRWESVDACVEENAKYHSDEDARAIAEGLYARINSGVVFKGGLDIPMKMLKGPNGEMVVYGPCSWAKRDPVGDHVTQGFMVDFFDKWFNKVPERYQNIMLDHDNFQMGIPLKSFVAEDGTKYFTHVHEVAPMLLAQVRSDSDGFAATKSYRKMIVEGEYNSYSISWFPVEYRTVKDDEEPTDWYDPGYTSFHDRGDPIEVTFCREGMVDVAKFGVVSKDERGGPNWKLVQKNQDLEKKQREILSKIPNAEDPEEEPEEEEDKAPEEEDTEESDEEDEEARKYYAFLLESVRDRTESIICQTDVVMHETKVPLELRLKLKSSFDEALRIVRKKERN